MKAIFAGTTVFAPLLCLGLAFAAPQPAKQTAREPQPPPVCAPGSGPDYVPGIDAKGRPVAPADLPSGTNVIVSTEIYPQIRSPNRLAPRTGLAVVIHWGTSAQRITTPRIAQAAMTPPVQRRPRR